MSVIAEELARRSSPDYIKSRASEATMEKMTEIKERTLESRLALAIIGGVVGASLGAALGRSRDHSRKERYRFEGRRPRPDYGERVESRRVSRGIVVAPGVGEGGGDVAEVEREEPHRHALKEEGGREFERTKQEAKERFDEAREEAKGTIEEVKGRAGHAIEEAKERISHIRERVPSREEVKHRASERWESQPLLFALLSLVVGALAGIFLPVSQTERRMLEPARHKAREGVRRLGEKAEERIAEEQRIAEEERPQGLIAVR